MGERLTGKLQRVQMSTTDDGEAIVLLEIRVPGNIEIEPRRWATGHDIEVESDEPPRRDDD